LVDKEKRLNTENKILAKIRSGKNRVAYLFKKENNLFSFPDGFLNDSSGLFNLKLFLKPKALPQNTRNSNDEIFKEWNVYPDEKNSLEPLIFNKENFYPEDDIYFDFLGLYWWGKKDMRVNLFNPNDSVISADFEFAVHSLGKARKLKIFLNDKLINEVNVPLKSDFSRVKVELLLNPGVNKVSFSCPLWKRSYMPKASVGFKDFCFTGWRITEPILKKEASVFDKNVIFVPQRSFLDIVFNSGKHVLLGRDMDTNLEDNPILVVKGELQDRHAAQLFFYLGVDYNNDGLIDGYLRLKDAGDFNVLDLIKKEWPQIREKDTNICKLKKMFILIVSNKIKADEEKKSVFRLQEIIFVHKKSLKLLDTNFSPDKVAIGNKNSKNLLLSGGRYINILGYFEPGAEDKTEAPEGEITCFIPRDDKEAREFPIFSFNYKIGLPQEQLIELFILAEDYSNGEIKRIPLRVFSQFSGSDEIRLTDFVKDNLRIKGLLFSLRKKGVSRESVDWYEFMLGNFKFFNTLTYSEENEWTEERLNTSLVNINPGLVRIDSKLFRFNDFTFNKYSDLSSGYILEKEIELFGSGHSYEKIENETFDLEWAILEPLTAESIPAKASHKAEVSFKKVNPTKYILRVKGAREPFWVVFNENFSPKWSLYQGDKSDLGSSVDSPFYVERYTMGDIKYIFRKPLKANHRVVNGYANGWYVDPEKLGLTEDSTLVVYYSSQSGIYLSFIISGIAILLGIGYLLIGQRKNEK
jgi:hypothetical protein